MSEIPGKDCEKIHFFAEKEKTLSQYSPAPHEAT